MHAGEIVGFVGLRGAGQEAIGRALFGVIPTTSGRVVLDGRPIAARNPREAMARGVNLVCADRVGESIMPNLSVRENMFLNPCAAKRGLFSLLGPRREGRAARQARLGRGAAAERSRPRDRVAVGRQSAEGGRRPLAASGGQLYVFEDPTAGVDVGAKAEIYRLFDVALQAGAAILIVSTDFEEVAQGLPPRVGVRSWPVVAELAQADLSVKTCLPPLPPESAARRALELCSNRRGALMQSLKSSALEPTRPELAGLRWGKRFCAWRRSTGFPF